MILPVFMTLPRDGYNSVLDNLFFDAQRKGKKM